MVTIFTDLIILIILIYDMAVTMKETRAPLRNIAQIIRRGQCICA